ncbi:fructose-bisphosphate aldolase class I [Aestuariirhabdus sp. Z084]|uniref:class I fructose-bisphosphate aldolase n=1 Tax=Aestuariirhabdus haliotis TaxID=2918751 RepID=UPI0020BDBEFA|nr:class I fructose-bisphosphate aldolase [Aestuariirhabdus haliotis]MCL6416736.1 fructose-bisphosphate aldolase class I [Aestuariirhabdus haliotis]
MSIQTDLQNCIEDMIDDSRGILAADESSPTIAKRFASIGAESTEEMRRQYRSLLLSTDGLGEYICGVILFEETLAQSTNNGQSLPQLAWSNRIVPGIKVDKGLGDLPGAPGDKITFGLDGLAERLVGYKEQGARFAKWRELYPITSHNPTPLGLSANAEMLARYAAQCQALGVVPIVEPEVLMDGKHDIERCHTVTEKVLRSVFEALARHRVQLELLILKPNMVLSGKSCPQQAGTDEVAERTLQVLKRTVPAAVPSINFLSGGMTPEQATENLNSLNQGQAPWQLSTSYGRALQEPALKAWGGSSNNGAACQAALLNRARLNSLARQGNYDSSME